MKTLNECLDAAYRAVGNEYKVSALEAIEVAGAVLDTIEAALETILELIRTKKAL